MPWSKFRGKAMIVCNVKNDDPEALKQYPKGVYFGADKCYWGSTSDDAKYVWQSLAKEYPHAGQGNRMILWITR